MIKIYVSSLNLEHTLKYKKQFKDCELNVLLSYGTVASDYYSMIFRHREKISSLILDSGTFTKKFGGAALSESITFDGFLAYCKTIQDKFDMIFNFDEDFEPTGFAKNMRYLNRLKKHGVNVVPVVHDYKGKELDTLISEGFEMISLGWGKDGTKKEYYRNCVEKIKKAGKKVHLLGISTFNELHDVNADTCDSSNYAQAAKFGYIYYWDENVTKADKCVTLRFMDFTHEKDNAVYFEDFVHRKDVEEYFENTLGVSYTDLYGHRKHFFRMYVNLDYYVKLQDKVRAAHRLKGW